MTFMTFVQKFWLPLMLLVLAAGLYAIGHKNGTTACNRKAEAAQAKAIIKQQETAKQEQDKVIILSNELAVKLDDARKANKKLEGTLYVERQKPIYTNCPYGADSVQLYRSIIKK